MALRKNQMYTSMVDLEEYQNTDWVFVSNIKFKEEYNGIVGAFREQNIPWSLEEKGTMATNNFFLGLFVQPGKDTNYGMDVYVPVNLVSKAKKILANPKELERTAEIEAEVGQKYQAEFIDQVVAHKKNIIAEEAKGRSITEKLFNVGVSKEKPTGRLIRSDATDLKNRQLAEAAANPKNKQKILMMRIIKAVIAFLVIATTAYSLYSNFLK